MKNVLTIIFCFFLSLNSHAISVQQVKVFNQVLNNTEPKFESNSSQNECCTTEDKHNEALLQCTIDLCGTPDEVESVYISDQNFEENYKDEIKEKDFEAFKPKIKQYANKEIEKLKKDLKNIKNNIADNTDYFNVENLAFEKVKGVLENYFYTKVGSKVVRNEDGSKELEFYWYSDDKEEKLSEDMKFAFEQFKKYKNQELRTDFSKAIFYDYYSLEEAKAYTQKSLESAKVFINRLEQVDSYLLQKYKDSLDEIKETIKTAQENIDNVTLEPSDLSGVYGKLQYAHEIFESIFGEETEYAYIDPQEYKCDEEKCKKAVKEIVNNFDLKKKINLLELKLSETKDLDEKINACKAVWYMDDLLGVDPKLKEEIKNQIPQIKVSWANTPS